MGETWHGLITPVHPSSYRLGAHGKAGRIAHVVMTAGAETECIQPHDVVLVGFPEDRGVELNFGRPGARQAPEHIRTQFARLAAPAELLPSERPRTRLRDLGDIIDTGSLGERQEHLGKVLGGLLQEGALPVVLGGGHETAFGHFLAYAQMGRRVGIINLDAHFDVRNLISGEGHSGSSFRQAIEHGSHSLIRGGYLCIGAQESANETCFREFMDRHGARWIPLESCTTETVKNGIDEFARRCASAGANIMLTVDLDSVRQSDAPGVSAPSPIGLTAEQVLAYVRLATETGATSADISEFNHDKDRDDQTARLAALIVYHVITSHLARIAALED